MGSFPGWGVTGLTQLQPPLLQIGSVLGLESLEELGPKQNPRHGEARESAGEPLFELLNGDRRQSCGESRSTGIGRLSQTIARGQHLHHRGWTELHYDLITNL